MTANTPNRGYTYPQSTDHTRIWEHFLELATDIDTDVDTLADRVFLPPYCKLTRPGSAAGVATGGAVIPWDTEVKDASGWHTGSANAITPLTAGIINFKAQVHWSVNATGRRGVGIRINGGTVYYGNIIPGSSAGNLGVFVDQEIAMNGSTDYAEVFAYQDSGGSLNIVDTNSTFFSARWISPS